MWRLLLIVIVLSFACGDETEDPAPTSTLPSASSPVQSASATPDGFCAVRSLTAVNESGISFSANGAQVYRFVIRDDDGAKREVIVPPETDPTSCPPVIADTLELTFDGGIQTAAQDWVAARGGELVGLCRVDLIGDSGDPNLRDYCSFLPLLVEKEITITVGPTQSDDTTLLVLQPQDDGSYVVVEERKPTL